MTQNMSNIATSRSNTYLVILMISCDAVGQDVVMADVKSVTGAYCVSLPSDYACEAMGETHTPHRESNEMRQTQTTSSGRKKPLVPSDVTTRPLNVNKRRVLCAIERGSVRVCIVAIMCDCGF